MDWLIYINKDDLIDIAQCFSYEAYEYKFFPDTDGRPIVFPTLELARDWVIENVKPELCAIDSDEVRYIPLRNKYLKDKNSG